MSHVGRHTLHLFCFALVVSGAVEAGSPPASFDVQGHRGARGLAPENTLPAFAKAIELGVTTLELDVQITRDGIPVVHHDDRLNSRLCLSAGGGKVTRRPVSQVDYEEIANLDCGSRRAKGFPHQELFPGARIPRLTEVLELAQSASYAVWVSIEIKQSIGKLPLPLSEAVDRIVLEIEEAALAERTIIQSKWGEVLVAVRERAPGLERSLVVRIAKSEPWVETGVATIVSRKRRFLRRREVEELQQRGVRVIPWTVNKSETIEKLMDWGVDGVITDYPDRALGLLPGKGEK
jgi:glycerophosphoryl diester phosphodiesterase